MTSNCCGVASVSWLRIAVTLFIMRVCMSMTSNAIRDIRISDYTRNPETGKCDFVGGSDGSLNEYQIPVYLIGFFMPVLGGLVVDKWSHEKLVLCISGVLLLLSGIYFIAAEMARVVCIPAVYLVGLLPNCFANGIGIAPIVAAQLKVSDGQFGSPTPGLIIYYISASLGEFLGLLGRVARPYFNLTQIICASAPMVFIAMSAFLRIDWSLYHRRFQHQLIDGFQFPTKARLLRYFLLLAPLVLLVSVISITSIRGGLYCLEINFYLNRTSENITHDKCNEVFTGYNAATMVTLVLLAGCYRLGCLGRDGRITIRFFSGVVLLLLCRIGMIGWNIWAASKGLTLPDSQLTHTIYTTASAVDGIGNALALAAGYELMYRVASAVNKNLVMGFLFTIWAVGACIAGATTKIMREFPENQPILVPVVGLSNSLHVSHIVMSVEIALVLAYYGCVSVKLAGTVMELDEDGDYSTAQATHDIDEVRAEVRVSVDEEERQCFLRDINYPEWAHAAAPTSKYYYSSRNY